MELEHINNWKRHYDNLIWTVSSILLAANSLLINALIQTEECRFKVLITLLGLLLTTSTVYFAASFRNLVNGYSEKYYKDLRKLKEKDPEDEEDIRKIHSVALKQWLIYMIVFWLIGVFWSCWPIFSSKNYLLPCFITLIIITIYFWCIFQRGGYKHLFEF